MHSSDPNDSVAPDGPPIPKPATKRLVSDLKRQAKDAARAGAESHTQALERLARDHGYRDWHALIAACDAGPAAPPTMTAAGARGAPRSTPAGLPVDPVLPPDFDQTPNEDRSEEEIEAWWDRPYVLSCTRDGVTHFEVRCLDGGAWDRASWYGFASSLVEADKVVVDRRAILERFRSTPTVSVREDGAMQVVLLSSRPGQPDKVLHEAEDAKDAVRFLDRYRADRASDGR